MSVSKEPLNIRNNNPGNLRFVGQEGASQGDGGFAKFETPQAGLDAMRNQIELDTQKRGLNLTQFLNKYAPPSENKTTNYIDFVARKTGLDPSAPVPASAIPQLQAAMIEMEGGPRSMSYFMKTAQTTQTAQAPRTTVQRTGLPASYRFALAANYLGDTEKDSVTEKAMQLMEEVYGEPGGGAGAFKKKLQSILAPREKEAGAFDVLAKAQTEEAPKGKAVPKMPKMFADGGLVAAAANLQRPILKPEEKEFLAAREKEFAGYISQAEKYNEALDNYQKQYAAYEESMKGNPDYEAYTKAAEDYSAKVKEYQEGGYKNLLGASAEYSPYVAYLDPKYGSYLLYQGDPLNPSGQWGGSPDRYYRPGESDWGQYEFVQTGTSKNIYTGQPSSAGYLRRAGTQAAPIGDFTAKAPGSPPAEFTMEAPTPPTGLKYTWDQVQEYQNNAMTRAAKAARNRATALQVITGQGPYAGFGLSLFADGGEVGEQYESLEDVMAAAPTQDAEQRQWEQEIPVRELTRQLNETVDRYRAGRASEADVKQFFPNYSDYDIANMFGMTDAGQSGPRPEIIAQPFLTPEVYDRAMNRGRMDEYNIGREIREKSPNIYPNKRDFTLRLQQLADGGEVNYDQMMVGTLLPPPEEPVAPMVRPGVSVPTISEVPRVDAQGRVIREAPTPDQVYTPLQKAVGGAEALGTVVSGLTAPASILYDVARGVPAKEISPGRFMYEPRTEAGQEYAQGIGRLAQDLKLDVALPQVQLQRPYPVGAMARQATDIATGPIDRAKIRAAASRAPEDVAYDPLRERLESQGILSLATRPKGSAIDPTEELKLLQTALSEKGFDFGYTADLVRNSFVPKLENYLNRQFGTVDDPLYEATVSGKFLPQAFYRPNSLFRFDEQQVADVTGLKLKNGSLTLDHMNKLQQLAKEKNPDAIKLLGRGYDLSGATRARYIPSENNPTFYDIFTTIEKEAGNRPMTKGVLTPDPVDPNFMGNLSPNLAQELVRRKPVYEMLGSRVYGGIIDYDDVVDYMAENDPKKWTKMSVPELVLASSQDTSKVIDPVKIANYAYDGKELVPFQKLLGTETYLPLENSPALGKGAEWREIKTKEALLTEGGRSMLDHCLKSNTLYCNMLEKGEAKYFSLRDADGHPHATILVKRDGDKGPYNIITQIKGFQNSNTLPLYGEEVSNFLDHYQKTLGTKLKFSENPEYVPSKYGPKNFGIADPERNNGGDDWDAVRNVYAKGGMVDKPLYDRAA